MKHTSRLFFLFLSISIALMVFSTEVFSQIGFQAGAGAGYAMPVSDYAGETTDFYAGSKYGLAGGLNLQAKARIKLPVIQVTAELGYASLSNSGESEPNKGKLEMTHKILSLRLGPEYQFSLPGVPLTPYLGANLAVNSISGEVTFNGISSVPSGTFTVNSATRMGLGISGGAIFSLNPLLSLDIGIAYNMMNLIGQSWDDATPAKDQRIDSYTSLNDDKDPLPVDGSAHIIGNTRSINSVQITATILFGL